MRFRVIEVRARQTDKQTKARTGKIRNAAYQDGHIRPISVTTRLIAINLISSLCK